MRAGQDDARRQISAIQFFEAVIAQITIEHGVEETKKFSLRDGRFDRAFEAAFNKFRTELTSGNDCQLMFRIRVDDWANQSATLRETISRAAQLGVVSLDNPSFHSKRISMSLDRAERVLERVPIELGAVKSAAEELMHKYSENRKAA